MCILFKTCLNIGDVVYLYTDTDKKTGKTVSELVTVKGCHRNTKDKSKISVEFTQAASNGRKTASSKKLTLVKPNYNTGWTHVSV